VNVHRSDRIKHYFDGSGILAAYATVAELSHRYL